MSSTNSKFLSDLTLVLGKDAGGDDISQFGRSAGEPPQEQKAELAERRGMTQTERRHRKKMVERMHPIRAQHTPRGVAKASKMSIIAVHGNALDKIGFEICERANRSADLRLEKVISTYDIMEAKNNMRLRREQAEMKDTLNKIRKVRKTSANISETTYMSFPPKHLKLPPVDVVRTERTESPARSRSSERKVDLTPIRLPLNETKEQDPNLLAASFSPRIQVKDGFLTAYTAPPSSQPKRQSVSSNSSQKQEEGSENENQPDEFNAVLPVPAVVALSDPETVPGNTLPIQPADVLDEQPASESEPVTDPTLPIVTVTYSEQPGRRHRKEKNENARSQSALVNPRNVLSCTQLTIPYDQKMLNNGLFRHDCDKSGYQPNGSRLPQVNPSTSLTGNASPQASRPSRSKEDWTKSNEKRTSKDSIDSPSLTLPRLPETQIPKSKHTGSIEPKSEIVLFPPINGEADARTNAKPTSKTKQIHKSKNMTNSPRIKTQEMKERDEAELLKSLYRHKHDLQTRIEDFLSEDFESV